MYKIVEKPWGKEEWIELNDKYCYKLITVRAGYKTSLQYHTVKQETIYFISGEAEVLLENETGMENKIMVSGDFFTVLPTKKHRIFALKDVMFLEVSTPEVEDVVRVEDEYKRI